MPPPYFDWPPAPTWPDKYWWKCQTNLKKPVWQIPRNVQGQIQGEQKFSWSRWWRSGFETDQKGLILVVVGSLPDPCSDLDIRCNWLQRKLSSNGFQTCSNELHGNIPLPTDWPRKRDEGGESSRVAGFETKQLLCPEVYCKATNKWFIHYAMHNYSTTTEIFWFSVWFRKLLRVCAYYCVAMKPLPEKPKDQFES